MSSLSPCWALGLENAAILKIVSCTADNKHGDQSVVLHQIMRKITFGAGKERSMVVALPFPVAQAGMFCSASLATASLLVHVHVQPWCQGRPARFVLFLPQGIIVLITVSACPRAFSYHKALSCHFELCTLNCSIPPVHASLSVLLPQSAPPLCLQTLSCFKPTQGCLGSGSHSPPVASTSYQSTSRHCGLAPKRKALYMCAKGTAQQKLRGVLCHWLEMGCCYR